MKRIHLFLTILGLWVFAHALAADAPKIVSVAKIWDSAPHNAVGDLIRYRGKWLCTLREGLGHASHHLRTQDNGKVRVLQSEDGDRWTSAALIAEDGIDLRDPHLSITPDSRLMIVAGGSRWDGNGKYLGRRPRVMFSSDGRNWSQPQPVLSEGDWLWRVTWHKGRAYGVSYRGGGGSGLPRRAALYSSRDGVRYEKVVDMDVSEMNETTLRFLPGGEAIALARRESEKPLGRIGTSKPPYTQWTWHETAYRFGGPNFIQLPDGSLWAGSRFYPPKRAPGPGSGTTILARMERTGYEPVLTLPSGGDTSYPGLVWHENLLWMLYYSSHEGKASMYLAKIRLK